MAVITQKEKYLIFIEFPRGRKKIIRLEQNEEYSTSKNSNGNSKMINIILIIIIITVLI